MTEDDLKVMEPRQSGPQRQVFHIMSTDPGREWTVWQIIRMSPAETLGGALKRCHVLKALANGRKAGRFVMTTPERHRLAPLAHYRRVQASAAQYLEGNPGLTRARRRSDAPVVAPTVEKPPVAAQERGWEDAVSYLAVVGFSVVAGAVIGVVLGKVTGVLP